MGMLLIHIQLYGSDMLSCIINILHDYTRFVKIVLGKFTIMQMYFEQAIFPVSKPYLLTIT